MKLPGWKQEKEKDLRKWTRPLSHDLRLPMLQIPAAQARRSVVAYAQKKVCVQPKRCFSRAEPLREYWLQPFNSLTLHIQQVKCSCSFTTTPGPAWPPLGCPNYVGEGSVPHRNAHANKHKISQCDAAGQRSSNDGDGWSLLRNQAAL